MKAAVTILALALAGCSTMNDLGVGGEPRLACSKAGRSFIDDKLVGSTGVHLSVVRAFPDGAELCAISRPPPRPASGPAS